MSSVSDEGSLDFSADAGYRSFAHWASTSRFWRIFTAILMRRTRARCGWMSRRSTSKGAARFSDRDFLLIPGEEPDANFGGHYMFVFPKPVYFTHARKPTNPNLQPYSEEVAPFGKVYHTSTAANELQLLKADLKTRPRVADTPANQRVRRLPGRHEGHRLLSQRSISGRLLSIPAGRSFGETAVRGALPWAAR